MTDPHIIGSTESVGMVRALRTVTTWGGHLAPWQRKAVLRMLLGAYVYVGWNRRKPR